jgi:hypothetical protein
MTQVQFLRVVNRLIFFISIFGAIAAIFIGFAIEAPIVSVAAIATLLISTLFYQFVNVFALYVQSSKPNI